MRNKDKKDTWRVLGDGDRENPSFSDGSSKEGRPLRTSELQRVIFEKFCKADKVVDVKNDEPSDP